MKQIATVRRITNVSPAKEFEAVSVNGEDLLAPIGKFKNGDLCVVIENDRYKIPLLLEILNAVYPDEEMIVGNGGIDGTLQLGPYDDAIKLTDGTDVTQLMNYIGDRIQINKANELA